MFNFLAVFVDDGGQRVVREGGLDRVVQFDVVELGPADDVLLLLGAQGVPLGQVMQVLLDDHVAAPGVRRVLGADHRRLDRVLAGRVLRPVHEADQVPVVEVAEAVHLVDGVGGLAQPRADMRGQFEAQVHPVRADMEQQVRLGGDGVPLASPDFAERVQSGGPLGTGQPVPQRRPEAHHTGQRGVEVTEPDRSQQSAEIAAQPAHRRVAVLTGPHGDDEENRRSGQRRGDRLSHRLRRGAARGLRGSVQGHQRSWSFGVRSVTNTCVPRYRRLQMRPEQGQVSGREPVTGRLGLMPVGVEQWRLADLVEPLEV